jgi:hypothetical protein
MNEPKRVIGKPWQPGESGNPGGRPIGARGRFSEQMISDIARSWSTHGPAALEKMAKTDNTRYVEICSRLIPKDVALTVQQQLPGGLDPADWSSDAGAGAGHYGMPAQRRPATAWSGAIVRA